MDKRLEEMKLSELLELSYWCEEKIKKIKELNKNPVLYEKLHQKATEAILEHGINRVLWQFFAKDLGEYNPRTLKYETIGDIIITPSNKGD